jgi:hypothetical protein
MTIHRLVIHSLDATLASAECECGTWHWPKAASTLSILPNEKARRDAVIESFRQHQSVADIIAAERRSQRRYGR